MPLLFIKKMKQSDMYIHLKGLKLFAFHGVLPQENKVGAEIIIKFLIKWLLFPVKRCKLLWYKAYKCAKKGRLANWVILRKGRKKRK